MLSFGFFVCLPAYIVALSVLKGGSRKDKNSTQETPLAENDLQSLIYLICKLGL